MIGFMDTTHTHTQPCLEAHIQGGAPALCSSPGGLDCVFLPLFGRYAHVGGFKEFIQLLVVKCRSCFWMATCDWYWSLNIIKQVPSI